MTWSLRTRVMGAAGVVLALAVGGSGIVLFGLVRSSLSKGLDDALAAQVRTVAGMVQIDGTSGDLVLRSASGAEPDAGILPELFEVVAEGRNGVRHTPALSDAFLPHPSGGTAAHPEVSAHQLPNGHPGRIATATVPITPTVPPTGDGDERNGVELHGEEHEAEHEYESVDKHGRKIHVHVHGPRGSEARPPMAVPPLQPAAPIQVAIVVAQETAGLDHELAVIGWLLLMVTGTTIVVSEWLMAWAVRRSLRPLDALAEGIAGLGDADPGQRVAIANLPAELAPVVGRLNELLERIEDALARERGFSADVSHELRTPLSGLLSTIDVCLRKQRDSESYHHALVSCRRITRQMESLVGNLLDLTRLESGHLPAQREPVDLSALIRAQWRPYAERATMRRITVDWRPHQGLALTDGERLGQVLGNLFDNAVSYVDEGGSIAVSGSERDGLQVITIANTGNLITADQAAHVFERFWRADSARTDSQRHCGLGLTLCRRLMTVLGGSITARARSGGWFEIELVLPGIDLDADDDELEAIANGSLIAQEPRARAVDASGPHATVSGPPGR